MLGEENIGRSGPYMINDVYFIYDDTTDDRHRRRSAVVYLDGHAGDIEPLVVLCLCDTRRVPAPLIDGARATHPLLQVDGLPAGARMSMG